MAKHDVEFDYELQCWIIDGRIAECGHPKSMVRPGQPCCEANRFYGLTREEAQERIAKK